MPIIRLTITLVFVAVFVLGATYLLTRNSKYLVYIKQLLKYTGWAFIVLFVLYLITRVIRF